MSQRQTAAGWWSIGGILGALLSIGAIALGFVTGGATWLALGAAVVGSFSATVGAGMIAGGAIGTFPDEMGTKTHPSIRGAMNASNPNGKVPLLLGKHLLSPGYLSPSYTVVSGIDGIDEYRHMAFVLGYGPLSVRNIQFGETLIASNSGNVTNGMIPCDGVLPGCEVEIRQDALAGHGLDLYPKEVIQQDFSIALNRYHELDNEISGATITVSASARTFTRSTGDWTDSENDVRVGDYIQFNNFANAGNNGEYVVTGVSPTVIYCNQASALVDESKKGGDSPNVWARVFPANIQVTAKHTTRISVTITFPKLVKYSGSSKKDSSVWVHAYYRLKAAPGAAPAPWTRFEVEFDGTTDKITRAKAETLRFNSQTAVLPAGQYEVMVARKQADETDTNIQNAVYWTALRSFTDIDIMPVQQRKTVCVLGIRAKSSEAIANCITRLNCIVSADYSYIASADPAHSWASIIASNPQNTALAFVHALMGPGNPRPRTAAQMDWASIYAFAQWCDTPKGKAGGTQYRVETNGVITHGGKLSSLINEILTPAIASLTRIDGKYGVVWDQAQTVVRQHLGPHNSWGFKGSGKRAEAIHGYRVRFINRDVQYTPDERIVLDDGYKHDTEQDGVLRDCWGVDKSTDPLITEATKFETIDADLITDPAQVFGWVRKLLAIRRLRPEVFTVSTDAESLDLRRGNLVKVLHPAPAWGLTDGRIASLTLDGSGNITAIETDNALTMEAGKSYAVRIRTAAGTSIYRTVATVAGITHTLALSEIIPAGADIPATGDWFGFGIAGLETVDCIVAGMSIDSDLNVSLTLFEAAPGVHAADYGAIPAFESKVSFGPTPSGPSSTTPIYPPGADPIPYPATKALLTLMDTVDFDGQYGIYGGTRYVGTTPNTWLLDDTSAIHAELSNDNQTVVTDANGNGGNYSFCVTTLSVYRGAVDDSANWTFDATPSAGVAGTKSGTPVNRTYTVSAMTTDNGYVDITASRSGYSPITKRFTLSKSKTGEAGTSPTSYTLSVDVAAVKKSTTGVYTPSAITASAKSVTGGAGPVAYAGRFVIATSDGSIWTDRYTSSADESSKAYTVPASITAIRARLYASGGTGTLLDEEIVPIVADGDKGDTGANGTRTAILKMYQWAASAPTLFPSGNSTYTWATCSFTAPATPNGWTLVPGAAIAGQTLYECVTVYSDSLTGATSAVTWSATSANPVGAAGTPGTPGSDGKSGITPILDNANCALPASSAGAVSSYVGSGCKIQVYEGSTLLVFHTTLAAGRFIIGTPTVSPSGKLAVGARSGSGTTAATVANHSAMADATDLVSISYPITARRADGTDVSFELIQTIGKSKAGNDAPYGRIPVDIPWAYYSFDDLPDIPDNVAGISYRSDFSAGVDGWVTGQGSVISASGGALTVTKGTNAYGLINNNGGRLAAGKVMRIKTAKTGGLTSVAVYVSSMISMSKYDMGDYYLYQIVIPASNNNTIYFNTTSGPITVYDIYIGDGSCHTPVLNNAGNHDHPTISARAHPALGSAGKGLRTNGNDKHAFCTAPQWGTEFSIVFTLDSGSAVSGTSFSIFGQRFGGATTDKGGVAFTYYGPSNSLTLDTYSSTAKYSLSLSSAFAQLSGVHRWGLRYKAGQLSIWRDGLVVASSAPGNYTVDGSGYPVMYLGRNVSALTNGEQTIDEVVIYLRGLSDEEMLGLAMAGKLPKDYGVSDYDLIQMGSDGVIAREEKPSLKIRWLQIINHESMINTLSSYSPVPVGEFLQLQNEATNAGCWFPTTAGTRSYNYYQATENLRAALFSTPGILLQSKWDMPIDIAAMSPTFKALWVTYASAKMLLIDEIATKKAGIEAESIRTKLLRLTGAGKIIAGSRYNDDGSDAGTGRGLYADADGNLKAAEAEFDSVIIRGDSVFEGTGNFKGVLTHDAITTQGAVALSAVSGTASASYFRGSEVVGAVSAAFAAKGFTLSIPKTGYYSRAASGTCNGTAIISIKLYPDGIEFMKSGGSIVRLYNTTFYNALTLSNFKVWITTENNGPDGDPVEILTDVIAAPTKTYARLDTTTLFTALEKGVAFSLDTTKTRTIGTATNCNKVTKSGNQVLVTTDSGGFVVNQYDKILTWNFTPLGSAAAVKTKNLYPKASRTYDLGILQDPDDANAEKRFGMFYGSGVDTIIDLSSASSEYTLKVGEVAKIKKTSVSSVALNIATAGEGLYEMFLQCKSPNMTGDTKLQPNNADSATSNIYYQGYWKLSTSGANSESYALKYFRISYNNTHTINARISTKSMVKAIEGKTTYFQSSNYDQIGMAVFAAEWCDVASPTAWTSLGTIVFPGTVSSVDIFIRRIA